jgi:hypothetical protein
MNKMDHNPESQKPAGKNKIIWIIVIAALVIFAAKYYDPADSDSVDLQKSEPDKTSSLKSSPVDNSEEESEPELEIDTSDPNYVDSSDIKPSENDPNMPTGPTNACGYFDYGLADYSGTTKEGKTCADTVEPLQDNECVANPPKNYDGEIHIGDSDKTLSCCAFDGTCQWGVHK